MKMKTRWAHAFLSHNSPVQYSFSSRSLLVMAAANADFMASSFNSVGRGMVAFLTNA